MFPGHNIVDASKEVVDLSMPDYKEIFKGAPPGNRAHQLFTVDANVVQNVVSRFQAVLAAQQL